MDRETLSAARLRSQLRLGWQALPLAALLVYCEARQAPEGPSPKAPPFRIAASAAAAPPKVSASFSLSDFRPLLTSPDLANVAALLETGTPQAAARELEAWLGKSPPLADQRFRYDFLLARLHEQGAEFAPALAAYEQVAAGNSSLANYARTGSARMLLALGRAKEVPARVALVPESEQVSRLKWPVLAEAARLTGDRPAAITAYGRTVAAMPAGSDRADSELALATLLLGGPAPEQHAADVLQALDLARRIQDEVNASHATLVSATRSKRGRSVRCPSRSAPNTTRVTLRGSSITCTLCSTRATRTRPSRLRPPPSRG